MEHNPEIDLKVDVRCDCVIEYLLDNPFLTLSYHEKHRAVERGRPRPTILLLAKNKDYTRRFHDNLYDSIPWLCGCKETMKLYCWPCTLFHQQESIWTKQGFGDMNNVHKAQKRHRLTTAHITCLKKLKLFVKNVEFSARDNFYMTVEKQNENVRNNRHLLKYVIKVICFLVKQQLNIEEHCSELVREFCEFDNDLKIHMESNAVFSQFSVTSTIIQRRVIEAMITLLTNHMKKEVNEAMFVSLILNETDATSKSHLSVILRYFTPSGVLKERVLGIVDINKDQGCLHNASSKILQSLDLKNKLVSQSYDGVAVVTNEHIGLKIKLKEDYKNALFVHCCGHKLNFVLSQALSNFKECNTFFKSLSCFAKFFMTQNPDLISEIKSRFPCLAPTRWKFSTRLVETIHENKRQLEDLLLMIIENSDKWGSDFSCTAQSLLIYLRCFNFNFFLTVFTFIFPHSHILFQVLQKKICNVDICVRKINDFKNYLLKLRDNFESVWSKINTSSDTTGKRKKVQTEDNDKFNYALLYYKIIDTICRNISERFSDVAKLRFISLLDANQYEHYSLSFPESAFNSLKDNYGEYFDMLSLRSELIVVYSDADFRNHTLLDTYDYLKSLELYEVFPETYKLSKLILTIPVASSLTGPCTSIKQIRNYYLEGKPSYMAPLFLEKDLLDELSKSHTFCNEIIDFFAKGNPEFDLVYQVWETRPALQTVL